MNIKMFIDRPVLSVMISVLIVLAGALGLKSLPMEQYPDIAPPTVMVSTMYPGANAETILNAVIAPLEEAINGVENMDYMESMATNAGTVTINVLFRQGTDPDMAAVFVQNRVSKALGELPSEVTQIGVTVNKRQKSMIYVFDVHATDESYGYDLDFLSNYADINIRPALKRVQGVGDVQILSDTYGMRVWFNPDAMAQHNLVPSDVVAIIKEQNLEAATGSFGEMHNGAFEFSMKYSGRKKSAEEFENMIIKALPTGEVLRLGDIAHVELGTETYGFSSRTNDQLGAELIVYQTAGSNANKVIKDIEAFLADVEADMPEGMEISTMYSINEFLDASIAEVIKSLLIAILLVVLVVYFFLQDFRATLIPTIGIFVSMIGTFAFMAVAGFSINLLTLFALVLAIGTVVDNAIVVVEAVQAKLEVGYQSTYHATSDAMDGISAAIITSTLVFMAVFIPVAMTGGTSGIFYTQFGITMAVSVGISAINALTLSPALSAILLKPYKDINGEVINSFSARFRDRFNTGFNAVINKYKRGVTFFVRHKLALWGSILGSIVLLVVFMMTTPTGLVPNEDKGAIMMNISMPAGTSMLKTDETLLEIYERIKDIPGIEIMASTAGFGYISDSGPCYGSFIIKLKNWSERKGEGEDYISIMAEISRRCADIKDAEIIPFAPAMISGYGTTNGFEFNLQDRTGGDIHKFYKITQDYVAALNARPEINGAFTTFNPNFPQYLVDVDAAKCKRAGVSPSTVLSTLGGYFSGQYVSNVNLFSRVYRVMIQADEKYRTTPEAIKRMFVRMDNGQMAPLSQFITINKVYGPQALTRFNMFVSTTINGNAAPGYSSGDVIKVIDEVADEILPRGYSYEYSGLTREESRTSNSTLYVYLICIVLIYIILCCFYESFFVPIAIIISVPCGIMGSFLFAKLFGLENNIYLQTGVIMLIGLLSKTAILITECATTMRRAGMSLHQAAIGAAKVRLRPILMTALTMIFGMLPMMFANGVGANGNKSLGTSAVGGMLVGTLVLIFLVPALFIVFQKIEEKFKPVEFKHGDWATEAEIELIREQKQAKHEPDNIVKF